MAFIKPSISSFLELLFGALLSKYPQSSYPLIVCSALKRRVILPKIHSFTIRDVQILSPEKSLFIIESSSVIADSNDHHNCNGIKGSEENSSLNRIFSISLFLKDNSTPLSEEINCDTTSAFFSLIEIEIICSVYFVYLFSSDNLLNAYPLIPGSEIFSKMIFLFDPIMYSN